MPDRARTNLMRLTCINMKATFALVISLQMARDDPVSRHLPPYRTALADLEAIASSPVLLAPLEAQPRVDSRSGERNDAKAGGLAARTTGAQEIDRARLCTLVQLQSFLAFLGVGLRQASPPAAPAVAYAADSTSGVGDAQHETRTYRMSVDTPSMTSIGEDKGGGGSDDCARETAAPCEDPVKSKDGLAREVSLEKERTMSLIVPGNDARATFQAPLTPLSLSFESATHRRAIEELNSQWLGEPLLPAPLPLLSKLLKAFVATVAAPANGSFAPTDNHGISRNMSTTTGSRSSRKITPTSITIPCSSVSSMAAPAKACISSTICVSPGSAYQFNECSHTGGRRGEPPSPLMGPRTPVRSSCLSNFAERLGSGHAGMPGRGGWGGVADHPGGGNSALSSQLLALSRAPFWRQHRQLFGIANALLEPILQAVCADASITLVSCNRGHQPLGVSNAVDSRCLGPTSGPVLARFSAAVAEAQAAAVSRLESSLRLLTPKSVAEGIITHAVCEIAPLISVAVAESMREAAGFASRGPFSPVGGPLSPKDCQHPLSPRQATCAQASGLEPLSVMAQQNPPSASSVITPLRGTDSCCNDGTARSHSSNQPQSADKTPPANSLLAQESDSCSRGHLRRAVSYTHLTLPTKRRV